MIASINYKKQIPAPSQYSLRRMQLKYRTAPEFPKVILKENPLKYIDVFVYLFEIPLVRIP